MKELLPVEVMAARWARLTMLFSEGVRLLQPTEAEVKVFQEALSKFDPAPHSDEVKASEVPKEPHPTDPEGHPV
jgi:hypothetical protein